MKKTNVLKRKIFVHIAIPRTPG